MSVTASPLSHMWLHAHCSPYLPPAAARCACKYIEPTSRDRDGHPTCGHSEPQLGTRKADAALRSAAAMLMRDHLSSAYSMYACCDRAAMSSINMSMKNPCSKELQVAAMPG